MQCRRAFPGAWQSGSGRWLCCRRPTLFPALHVLQPESEEARSLLRELRLQRAIGVIYQPRSERQSHYFHAQLPDQFDAILHFDETRAVEPLERTTVWKAGEVPETYPSTL